MAEILVNINVGAEQREVQVPRNGRPPLPAGEYRTRFLNLETRCKRAGLDINSKKPLKEQLAYVMSKELQALRKTISEQQAENEKLKTQISNLKKRSFMAVFSNSKRRKPYSLLSNRRKKCLRGVVSKAILTNSNDIRKDKMCFIIDYMKGCHDTMEISQNIQEIFKDKKIGAVIQQGIVNKAVQRASKSEVNRMRDFVIRKRLQLSVEKKKQLNKTAQSIQADLGNGLTVSNVVVPCSSDIVKTARANLRRMFPLILPNANTDQRFHFRKLFPLEHAVMDTVAVIKSALCLFYCTEEFYPHWQWFYSPELAGPKVHHIELSTFYDSCPLGSEPCTGLYLRLLNAAGLIHKPEFTFILFLAQIGETSVLATKFMELYSNLLSTVIKNGLQLKFEGFSDERTVPHTTIPLNGTHFITFGTNTFAADGKAQLWANGCKAANSSFTPEYKHHKNEMVNPNFPE
jgi:hypothetical protein